MGPMLGRGVGGSVHRIGHTSLLPLVFGSKLFFRSISTIDSDRDHAFRSCVRTCSRDSRDRSGANPTHSVPAPSSPCPVVVLSWGRMGWMDPPLPNREGGGSPPPFHPPFTPLSPPPDPNPSSTWERNPDGWGWEVGSNPTTKTDLQLTMEMEVEVETNTRDVERGFDPGMEEVHREEVEAEGTGRNTQDARKARGGYVPRFRSANFALLVVLHRNQTKGIAHMGKPQLLQEATVGDLCERPPAKTDASRFRHGTGNNSQGSNARTGSNRNFCADGWQGFSKMLKGQPPLVAAWSNPRRISLTPKGWEVACKLHAAAEAAGLCRCGWNAHDDGTQEPPPAILDAQLHALRPDGTTQASIGRSSKRKQTHNEEGGSQRTKHRSNPEDPPWGVMDASIPTGSAPSESPNVGNPRQLAQAAEEAGWSGQDGRVQEELVQEEMDRLQCRRSEWMLCGAASPSQTQLRVPPLQKGERCLDRYELVLLIDQREQYCASHPLMARIEEFSNMGVRAELRVLPQGDATWILRQKNTGKEWIADFVVERKRVDDLFSSIKSKRYDLQKHLMARSGQRCPMYLIEGDVNGMEVAAALKTASFTTAVCDGFRVYHTDNVNTTLRLLGRLTHSLSRKYRKVTGPSDVSALLPTYDLFDEESKNNRSDVSVSQVFGLALLQVPGIGPETAEAILRAYPTISGLYKEYQKTLQGVEASHEDRSDHCRKLLGNIAIAGAGKRTVGSVKSRAVFEKLFGSLAP